jgi:hypothetical protein
MAFLTLQIDQLVQEDCRRAAMAATTLLVVVVVGNSLSSQRQAEDAISMVSQNVQLDMFKNLDQEAMMQTAVPMQDKQPFNPSSLARCAQE